MTNNKTKPFLVSAIGISGIVIGLILTIGSLSFFGILIYSGAFQLITIAGMLIYFFIFIGGIGVSFINYKFLKGKSWAFKTLQIFLIVIVIGAGISTLFQFINVAQSGLEQTEIIKIWFLIALFIISGLISVQLQTPLIKPFFGVDVESVDSLLLRRFKKILLYGGLSILVILLIPLGLPFVSKEDWPFIRAKIAEKTGGTEHALSLYAKTMINANSQSLKDNAHDAISKLQFSMALKHYHKREYNQAVELLMLLAQNPLDLDKETQEQLPETLYNYGMELKDKKEWNLSRNLFMSLVRSYPAHKHAEKVGEFQKWYFDKIISVETKENIAIPVYEITNTGLKKIREENYTSPEGTTLLLLTIKIAHLGRRTKELQAENFTLRDAGNQTVQCSGFKTEYGIEEKWNDKSVTIGPDPIEVTLIFEIQKTADRYKLEMFGEGITKFAI